VVTVIEKGDEPRYIRYTPPKIDIHISKMMGFDKGCIPFPNITISGGYLAKWKNMSPT